MIALVNYHALSVTDRAIAPIVNSVRPKRTLVSN
jgi:hypothetical protein